MGPEEVCTLADRYYEVDIQHMKLESEVGDMLDAALPEWEDWTADYYDGSIEVYGMGLVKTPEALAARTAAGFSLCWIHAHPKTPRGHCACPVSTLRIPNHYRS